MQLFGMPSMGVPPLDNDDDIKGFKQIRNK